MAFTVAVKWDHAGMKRVDRTLGSFQGKQLERRVEKAMGVAIRPMGPALRSAEQGSGIVNRTGEHLRKIKLRKNRKRTGEMAAYTVGPSDRKKHLLIRGHRIVTRSGRDTGQRSQAFDYVEPVQDRMAPQIVELVNSIQWAEAMRIR